jgi:hypothetical protein
MRFNKTQRFCDEEIYPTALNRPTESTIRTQAGFTAFPKSKPQ